jgi:hypothetical protein
VTQQFLLLLMICGAADCHWEPVEKRYPSMIACLEAGFTLMEQTPNQMRDWRCEKSKIIPY